MSQQRPGAPPVDEVRTWPGRELVDRDGVPVGTITDIYLDRSTGEPWWALIRPSAPALPPVAVPLLGAWLPDTGERVQLAYGREVLQGAPAVRPGPDGELGPDQEARLYAYYGLEDALPGVAPDPPGDDAMTRSEEELEVRQGPMRPKVRARLKKYVVTEYVTRTVPVEREEVRVEYEPVVPGEPLPELDPGADPRPAGEPDQEQAEVVLYDEEVVVEKRRVPRERVRLTKQEVTDERQVTAELRKERIEVEEDEGGGRG